MAKTHYLKDYQAILFKVLYLDLQFEIQESSVLLTTKMKLHPKSAQSLLLLDGSAKLLSISLNNEVLAAQDYEVQEEQLYIKNYPQQDFMLTVVTEIYPQENKSLMGLYASQGNLYTQCEAEGFRKMTYFFDRPDVMTQYTTTIIADKKKYPVLLSNGNLIEEGELDNQRHWVKWHDPYAKPSYLFALVAGQLVCTTDRFITMSGKEVAIRFYTREKDQAKVYFAIESLKHAMKWDETRFGLEYDLNIFMVVAVEDFNMGAMENKGLNIFNTKYVLANSQTATDADFEGIESVIGHEYFHNYTGNRVTCRDWFQLSLKEGLTVFRDQEFSADRASRAVRRIHNVNILRAYQFPEDAGPTAHPVRPESYEEINNFYTLTIYEKGAEVVRMYHTILGEEGFQKGMRLYFERYDGQAVTCDDFRLAMADANGLDLSQFDLWYRQFGTPVLDVNIQQDEILRTLTIHIRQSIPINAEQQAPQAMMIPVKLGLINHAGEEVSFCLQEDSGAVTETVLICTKRENQFTFYQVTEQVIPSLLRGFSAPVILNYAYSETELNILMVHDKDTFVRWEAAQILYKKAIEQNIAALEAQQPIPQHLSLLEKLKYLLVHEKDDAFCSLMLQIPSQSELLDYFVPINPLVLHQAREALLDNIAQACHHELKFIQQRCLTHEQNNASDHQEAYNPEMAATRSLFNTTIALLCRVDTSFLHDLLTKYAEIATNMTYEMGILKAINNSNFPERRALLEQFANRYQNDTLVLDKYFSLIASSYNPHAYEEVIAAMQHPAFSIENPNKVRALFSTLTQNPFLFHAKDGSGYRLIANTIIELDRFNPQIAARMAQSFNTMTKVNIAQRHLMLAQIEKIARSSDLSKDTVEIISKIKQSVQ